MKMIIHIKAQLRASNKDVAKKKIQYSFKNDNRYLSTPSFTSNEQRLPFDLQHKNVPRFPWRHGESPASSHAPGPGGRRVLGPGANAAAQTCTSKPSHSQEQPIWVIITKKVVRAAVKNQLLSLHVFTLLSLGMLHQLQIQQSRFRSRFSA